MWNDKESFISWLYEEKEKSYQILVKELKKLNYENIEREHIYNSLDEIRFSMIHNRKIDNLCHNINTSIDYKTISNKIIDYLDYCPYKEKIELWQYNVFFLCNHYIEIFNRSKLSKDKKTYDREVKKLKQMADTLKPFSSTSIKLIIPKRPQEILSFLVSSFYFIDKEITNYFLHFFGYSTKNISIHYYVKTLNTTNHAFFIDYQSTQSP